MKFIKPTLIVLLSLMLMGIITGFIYEQVSRMKARKYEIGETFVDVGGYKLHYKAMGIGKPMVVFESGLDVGGLLPWYKVQPEVAKFASTISYDRAGIFMSERGNKPKTGDAMAIDLYTLLKKTGHPGPYILVGHSMAGVTLRSFVDKYPDEVAGVVFVDASHPLQIKRFATDPVLKILPPEPPLPAKWIDYLVSNLGFSHFAHSDLYKHTYPSTVSTDQVNVIDKYFISISFPAAYEEIRALDSIFDRATYLKKFGNIPFIVITGTDKMKRGVPDAKTNQASMKCWMELQNDHLNLSTNSKHILAQKSGHYVQLDEPQIVIDAVRQLIGNP